jgi:hypothetical protein
VHLHRRNDLNHPKWALGITLLVGATLTWVLPVGGALVMVAAGFGLAIVSESELPDPVLTAALVEPATPRR